MVLAHRGFSWGCSHIVTWGWSHLKPNWGWRIQGYSLKCLAVNAGLGQELCFSAEGPFHGLFKYLHVMGAGFPRTRSPRESMAETTVSFMTHPWKSHAVISAISLWLPRPIPFIIESSYTGALISGGRYHWKMILSSSFLIVWWGAQLTLENVHLYWEQVG